MEYLKTFYRLWCPGAIWSAAIAIVSVQFSQGWHLFSGPSGASILPRRDTNQYCLLLKPIRDCKIFELSTLLRNMQSSRSPPIVAEEKCPTRSIIDDVAFLRNVQTVQKLVLCVSTCHNSTSLEEYSTFRISLFRTLQICWISAALCETFSRELPLNWSSSFWVFDASTSTPGCITTLRTIFSPMKFLWFRQHFSCIPW